MPTTDEPPTGPRGIGPHYTPASLCLNAFEREALAPREVRRQVLRVHPSASGDLLGFHVFFIGIAGNHPLRLDVGHGRFVIEQSPGPESGPWELATPWTLQLGDEITCILENLSDQPNPAGVLLTGFRTPTATPARPTINRPPERLTIPRLPDAPKAKSHNILLTLMALERVRRKGDPSTTRPTRPRRAACSA